MENFGVSPQWKTSKNSGERSRNWTKRNSELYDGKTSKLLKKQNHTCGYCGLFLTHEEKVHLHHIDGNHSNWKDKNLMAVHESCHNYIHTSK